MSDQPFIRIGTPSRGGIIAIADHASNHVPAGMELGIPAAVIDLHRNEGDDALVVTSSDGHTIPGNIGADIERRTALYHRPYHEAFAQMVAEAQPSLILAIHSFTPVMGATGEERPWDVGLLYNQDDRAARIAIDLFAEMGLTVGDNEPYSGKQLNATMDRHAEANGIPYLPIEMRQDLIARRSQQAVWADRVALVADQTLAALSSA